VGTTGGSTVTAIERARSEGLTVVRAVILVDRQEGGLENIRQHVKQVSAIITRDELLTGHGLLSGGKVDGGSETF
jgi:orotate phosphoribosyltransferase